MSIDLYIVKIENFSQGAYAICHPYVLAWSCDPYEKEKRTKKKKRHFKMFSIDSFV
jgi:hypothetical protein